MKHHQRLWAALLAAGLLQAGAQAGSAGKTVRINHGGTHFAAANGTFGAKLTHDWASATLSFVSDIDAVALRQPLHAVHIGASLSSGLSKKTVGAGAIVANTRVYSKTSSKSFYFEFEAAAPLHRIGRSHMVGTIKVDLYAEAICVGQAAADLRADSHSVTAGVGHMYTDCYVVYTCSAGAGFGPDRQESDWARVMNVQLDTRNRQGYVEYPYAYWNKGPGGRGGGGVYVGIYDSCSADLEVYAVRGAETYHDSIANWSEPWQRFAILGPMK